MSAGGQQMQCRHVWITTCRTCGTNKKDWLPIEMPQPDVAIRRFSLKTITTPSDETYCDLLEDKHGHYVLFSAHVRAIEQIRIELFNAKADRARSQDEVFRLAELLRKTDPTWGSPMRLNRVLAVGEPCAGGWIDRDHWSCRCGAKIPEQCKTETAKP